MIRKIILPILLTVVTFANTFAIDNIRLGGQNQIKFMMDSITSGSPLKYFEDYSEFSIGYKWFDFSLAYEAYLPPFPSSYSSYGQGISRYQIKFTNKDLTMKAGMFYELFGNGITMNLYQNRNLNWDTNLNGFGFDYYGDNLELKIVAGAPKNQFGTRFKPLEGLDIRYFKGDVFQPGLTYVMTEQNDTNTYWSSFYSKLFLPFAEISSEFSLKDFANSKFVSSTKNIFKKDSDSFENGKAVYVTSNFYIGPLTLMAEGKYFKNFDLIEGVKLNNTPSAVKEHLYALLNEKQSEFSGKGERGFQLDLSGPIKDHTFLVNFSNSRDLQNKIIYQDIYSQFDLSLPKEIKLHLATGLQKDIDGQYLNFVINPELPINKKLSINGEFVHQYSMIDNATISGRKYFYQDYVLSLTSTNGFIISLLTSLTSDPQYQNNGEDKFITHNWLGVQFDWNFLKNNDLTIFAGSRKKGKVCAGGVCVQKPELNGIDIVLTSRF